MARTQTHTGNYVRYQGKTYRIVQQSYCENQQLYMLASRTLDGSPFPALKTACTKQA